MDLDGNTYEVEGTELLGRCLQHEIDHLHGKLFIDYLSVLKRRSAMSKWSKEKDKYPGFVRYLEADPAKSHEHPDEEL
jgi:peptide deformylase